MFARMSNLHKPGIALPFLSSRINLKLLNIPVTPRLIIDIDSSKVSGFVFDCILVVVLWDRTFLHIRWVFQYVSEETLFSRLLDGLMVPVCKNVVEILWLKYNTLLAVFLLLLKSLKNKSFLITSNNVVHILMSSMVSGLLINCRSTGRCIS